MKNFIQYSISGILLMLLFACSNDFLTETADTSHLVSTNIVVSPHWEAQDFEIYLPEAKNAGFTIENAPDWLRIDSQSGKFQNGVATIRCSALENSDFSQIGFYNVFVILNIENKGKYSVQVAYINEGNPKIETGNSIDLNYNNQPYITIYNRGNGILVWEITEIPDWLVIDYTITEQSYFLMPYMMEGIYFKFNMDFISSKNLNGKIKIRSNDKTQEELIIEVNVDFGTPSLYCFPDVIDFRRTEIATTIAISNQGSGLLIWGFENCPEWLTVSEMTGTLDPYDWKTFTLTCNRDLLPAGEQSVVVNLKTNDKTNPVFPITVKARSANFTDDNVVAIDGAVVDTWFDKSTDLLYLATAKPNKLLVYNTKNRQIAREIVLNKAPTCFSVSEDGHKAIVGHGGTVSYVDMDNFSVTNTLDVNYKVYDIEWGVDDWFCYSPGFEIQSNSWYWKNTVTGKEYKSQESMYGETILKKIPHKNYIIASRLSAWPNGIMVFDVNTKEEIHYTHTDLGAFWFSTDGAYLYSSVKTVYRTSDLITKDDVSPIGQLSDYMKWLDHDASTNSLWGISRSSDYANRDILQLEATDYTLVKKYSYDDYYRATDGLEYQVQAHYVFANGTGTELVVVKGNSENSQWALEYIPVTK